MIFDLIFHLKRQKKWSVKTFGPGYSQNRIIDHIKKELIEVEKDPSIDEWVDVLLLAFDGALRSGASPGTIAAALEGKLSINEKRQWPDWRTADKDKAMEHIR